MNSSKLFSVLLLALVLVCVPQARAQEETWNVVRLAGDTLWACTLDSLDDTSLNLHCGGDELLIPIDSIVLVFREGKSAFVKGATKGGTIGGAAGAIVGASRAIALMSNTNGNVVDGWGAIAALGKGFQIFADVVAGTIVGGVGGALIGGAIGTATGQANSYDMEKRTLAEKLQIVRPLTVSGKDRTTIADTSSDKQER